MTGVWWGEGREEPRGRGGRRGEEKGGKGERRAGRF